MWGGEGYGIWPCLIKEMDGLASRTFVIRDCKCCHVSLLLVLLSLLVWALFSGGVASHQQLQVHTNLWLEWKELSGDWFSWGHILIHSINHYDQKKLTLLLVHLSWPWQPQRSEYGTWLIVYTKGDSPKRWEEKLPVEQGGAMETSNPIRCELQSSVSNV